MIKVDIYNQFEVEQHRWKTVNICPLMVLKANKGSQILTSKGLYKVSPELCFACCQGLTALNRVCKAYKSIKTAYPSIITNDVTYVLSDYVNIMNLVTQIQ